MAESPNGVIYLEVDEDITSAIDKLTKSSAEAVQIVTAKRSTLLQSVINLRLLKKAAEDAKKQLVLVTSDHVALNLAGRLGVPVASQVGETPRVPQAAAAVKAASEEEIDGGTVGEKAAPAASATRPSAPPSPLEAPTAAELETPAKPVVPVPQKPKQRRVPNISSMQKRLLWVGGGILVILLLLGLNYYLTSAKVTLYANADQVNASFNFTADPDLQQSDIKSATLSAQQLTLNKSLTGSVQATGTKDEGTKANGSMTIYNNYDSSSHSFVAGTRFVAPGGQVFRSTADVTVPGGSLCGGSICAGQATVSVQADANGDQYNLAPVQYTIPGLPSDQQSKIYGKGSQMQGGTTKNVRVITQGDVDKAKQAALDDDKPKSAKDLAAKASNQQKALDASLQQKVTSANSSPDVGSEAQTATVTVAVTYTELAVQKSALSDVAKAAESQQLGDQSQIYDDGSGSLQLTVNGAPTASGAMKFGAKATAYAGKKIDTAALAKQLKGKKYGEAADIASRVDGVDKADVAISPGWATSMPGIDKHIHIEIKVSGVGGQ